MNAVPDQVRELPRSVDEYAESFEPVAQPLDESLEPSVEPLAANEDEIAPPIFDPAFVRADETEEASVETLSDIVAAPWSDTQTSEPTFESTPADSEPSAFDSESVPPLPVEYAPEMPAADLMPVATPPPPPPEAAESDDDDNGDEDVPEADDAPDPPAPVAPQSLKDIKLDRSSLVRELSDLLR